MTMTLKALITLEVCPGAGLGAADDHPNCEMFTEHHYPDLARWPGWKHNHHSIWIF